jgi:hypothetical protein
VFDWLFWLTGEFETHHRQLATLINGGEVFGLFDFPKRGQVIVQQCSYKILNFLFLIPFSASPVTLCPVFA